MINISMATFLGMSTVDKVRAPYVLTDDELIKRDLLNEFNTKRGERVMRPQFGSIIWEVLMDPDSPNLEKLVTEDIEKIVKRDPRVSLLNVNTVIAEHALRSEVQIQYVASTNQDVLYLNYTRDAQEGVN
jgi:phage baseplate assembly protein W